MRSPGVIYRRYRQIKKKILYDKTANAIQCLHDNCYYGKVVTYKNEQEVERSIKVCNYNMILTEGNIELCTRPMDCSAFVNKWTRSKITEAVEKDLEDPETKRKLYPELSLMEWVLDKDLYDAVKNPGFFGNIIINCIAFLERLMKR